MRGISAGSGVSARQPIALPKQWGQTVSRLSPYASDNHRETPQDHVVVALARTVHPRPLEGAHLDVVCSAISSEQAGVSVDPSLDVHSKSAEKKTCGKHAKAVTE